MTTNPTHYSAKHAVNLGRIEAETLNLLFRGLSAQEIADLRHRSARTVEHTIKQIREKTGTHSTREAIYEALKIGWLESPARYVD